MLPVNYSSVKHVREKKKQSLEREKRVLQFGVTFVSLARLSREKNIINGRGVHILKKRHEGYAKSETA